MLALYALPFFASYSYALTNGEEWRLLNKGYWLKNCGEITAELAKNADVLDYYVYTPWKFASDRVAEFIGSTNDFPNTGAAESTISIADVQLPMFGASTATLNFSESDSEVFFSQVSENNIVMTVRVSLLQVVEDMFTPPAEPTLQTLEFAEHDSVELTQKVFGSPIHVSKLRRDSFSISLDHIQCSSKTVYEDLRAYLLLRLKQYEPHQATVFKLQNEKVSGFLSLYQRSKYKFAEVTFYNREQGVSVIYKFGRDVSSVLNELVRVLSEQDMIPHSGNSGSH
ncbi:MAG: hypothetical protein AAF098_19670 [Pseudomonadota bacterium]